MNEAMNETMSLKGVGSFVVQFLTRNDKFKAFVERYIAKETEKEEERRLEGAVKSTGRQLVCADGLYLGDISKKLSGINCILSDVYYRPYKKKGNYNGKQAYMIYFVFSKGKDELQSVKARDLLQSLCTEAVWQSEIYFNPSGNGSGHCINLFSKSRSMAQGNLDIIKGNEIVFHKEVFRVCTSSQPTKLSVMDKRLKRTYDNSLVC